MPRLWWKGQFLRCPCSQAQIRHASADRDLGSSHPHRLGVEELSGMDTCGVRQLLDDSKWTGPPPTDAVGGRKSVSPVPAVHPWSKKSRAQDGGPVRHSASLLWRERSGIWKSQLGHPGG